ncbi:hypothetical protein KCU85_g453, partial [Aureobasidium melanogenum]
MQTFPPYHSISRKQYHKTQTSIPPRLMAVVASFSWPTTAVYIGTPVDVALLYGVDRLPAVQGYRTFREVIPRYTRVRVPKVHLVVQSSVFWNLSRCRVFCDIRRDPVKAGAVMGLLRTSVAFLESLHE